MKITSYVVSLALLVFSTLFFIACEGSESVKVPKARDKRELTVVCTTGMIGDLVAAIAGEHALVKTLIGSGIDPHLYKATRSDIITLTSADLVFMIALHHELDNPEQVLDEAYRLLEPGGKVLIVDWKKEEMPEGPPLTIRCLPETIENQLVKSNFIEIRIFNELPKHFVIVARKPEDD